jgi:hypothetical protein
MIIGISKEGDLELLLELKEFDRDRHMHLLGVTGTGKSKLLEWMIRQDIKAGRGLCLIDPHGTLYKEILKYCVLKRLEDRVILFDPNDMDVSVGLNLLEYDPSVKTSNSQSDTVMDAIAKVFGGQKTSAMPQLQKYERGALIPLIESGLTLYELEDFVNPFDPTFRNLILQNIKNPRIHKRWEWFDKTSQRDRAAYAAPLESRSDKFVTSDICRRIFGQQKSTIDFKEAMDEGKIILCNLRGSISLAEQQMIGIVIIDKILQAGYTRMQTPEYLLSPFYVYLDEFQYFVSDDVSTALAELRKCKVRFILSHQRLGQLGEDALDAVLSLPQVRVCFKSGREDAEVLVEDVFDFKSDVVKYIQTATKFRPVRGYETVETYNESSSSSELEGTNEGQSSRFDPEEDDDLGLAISSGMTNVRGSVSNSGYSKSVVPVTSFEEFREETSRTFKTKEDQKEEFITMLRKQPQQHCTIKIKENDAMQIKVPDVKPVSIRRVDYDEFKQYVYKRYALPSDEVDRMIEERQQYYVDLAKRQKKEQEEEEIEEQTSNVKKSWRQK